MIYKSDSRLGRIPNTLVVHPISDSNLLPLRELQDTHDIAPVGHSIDSHNPVAV